MDAVRVALLREVLAGTEWLGATRRFAGVLRGSVVSHGGGLLLVGTPEYEPWHLAAHLVDEAAWSGTPELTPTLVRHDARASDPAHLAVGLGRLAAARRGETLLVVSPQGADARLAGPPRGLDAGLAEPPRGPDAGLAGSPKGLDAVSGVSPHGPHDGLLERVHDARRAGATVLALGPGEGDLVAMAHESLAVPEGTDLDLDTVQHLVSAAAGESSVPSPRARRRFRDRLSALADQLTAPPPARW
ncbi:hypothetical protein [Streptomyces sp. P17]|uniref:hypothetical protein n=1 Tax=Streptomyces sp. P17 TaxID=3074716 RepID=UPI0028F3E35A|nr:hypothetical protein [Streptomyces sp. P17]MDT9700090.1 hypothetical protein [Streptomyces sp. P17]